MTNVELDPKLPTLARYAHIFVRKSIFTELGVFLPKIFDGRISEAIFSPIFQFPPELPILIRYGHIFNEESFFTKLGVFSPK